MSSSKYMNIFSGDTVTFENMKGGASTDPPPREIATLPFRSLIRKPKMDFLRLS